MQTTIEVETRDRVEFRDITERIDEELPAALESGLCHVFVAHTTAGVVITEAESNLLQDAVDRFEALVPQGAGYAHDRLDDNAAAHLRSMLLGNEVSVPISGGDLALGTWQRLLLFDGDGPRTRSVRLTVLEA